MVNINFTDHNYTYLFYYNSSFMSSTDTSCPIFCVQDILRAVCSYLLACEVTALSRCDKKLAGAVSSDESIWRLICNRDLSVNLNVSLATAVRQNLHNEVIYGVDALMSWRETYLSWRSELREFKNSEIYRVKSFWDRITAYYRKHDPLNGGVIETLICQEPGWRISETIPRQLQLLYSFYDGQIFSMRGKPPAPLFGSYYMYGEFTFTSLFRSSQICTEHGFFAGCNFKRIGIDRTGSVYTPTLDGEHFFCSPSRDLFDWLDNFVSNLENKVFAFESIDMNRPSSNLRTVVQYPLPRGSDANVSGTTSKCFSSVVTNGIEVRYSYVFAPERSSTSLFVFIYTIRMRLLADHPTRHPRMLSCRLLRRHWKIFDSATGILQVLTVTF